MDLSWSNSKRTTYVVSSSQLSLGSHILQLCTSSIIFFDTMSMVLIISCVSKQLEGSVDDGSGRSEGEDDVVAKDEDDAFWEVEEISPAPKNTSPVVSKDKKAHMLRLRSFDKAATGRVAPVLRKSSSHKSRSSTKRLSPKSKESLQACFTSTSP